MYSFGGNIKVPPHFLQKVSYLFTRDIPYKIWSVSSLNAIYNLE